MKRLVLSAGVLSVLAVGSVVPALAAQGEDGPILPPLNNRYVCVMTQEKPTEQGICVWAPLPFKRS